MTSSKETEGGSSACHNRDSFSPWPAEAGEDQGDATLAAELQLVIARLAEKDARLAEKDAKLAENESKLTESEARFSTKLAEKDALVASLSEGHAIEDIEGMDLAVNDSHKMDQEADPKDQHYQQAAAEDAQNQVPAAENRRLTHGLTVVEPLLFGEKLVYHRDGTVEIETADGERIAEKDAYE